MVRAWNPNVAKLEAAVAGLGPFCDDEYTCFTSMGTPPAEV